MSTTNAEIWRWRGGRERDGRRGGINRSDSLSKSIADYQMLKFIICSTCNPASTNAVLDEMLLQNGIE